MSGLRAGRWKVLQLGIRTFYFLTFILKREALVLAIPRLAPNV